MDDKIFIFKQDEGHFTLVLGHKGVILSREEAEVLFVQLGHMLQDDDITK